MRTDRTDTRRYQERVRARQWINTASALMLALPVALSIVLLVPACGGDDEPNPPTATDAAGTGAPADAGQGADSGAPADAGSQPTNDGGSALCDSYCSTLLSNCSGNNAYDDQDVCITACQNLLFQTGTDGDTSGNTVQCRLTYAISAAGNANDCAAADLYGGNVCGSWCEVFCDFNLTSCVDANSQYNDEAACLTACADFADTGQPGDDMRDTVQCRMYHSGLPALRNPAEACDYTGVEPVNFCIDPI